MSDGLVVNSNNGMMDCTGSLRKIGRELLALEREDPELEARLEAASFLITYIANALDVELQYAMARGRNLKMGISQ